MRTTPIRRAVAAGASVAVATVGLAAFAPAAQAEATADFTCTVSLLGDKQFTVTADTDLPSSVEQGKKVSYKFTATVSVPDDVRGAARLFFGEEVQGNAAIQAKVGATAAPVVAQLPRMEVPAETGPLVLDVAGSGSWTPTQLGQQDVTVSGFTANLTFIKGGTPAADPIALPCVAPSSGPVVIDTVNVTKATVQSTSTTAKVKVAKKAKKATATVKVVNADKSAATGKVKLTLKKGKKKAGTKTVALNKKGQAKAVFKKLKKGKYTLVAQYQGNAGSKKSQKKVTFRVR